LPFNVAFKQVGNRFGTSVSVAAHSRLLHFDPLQDDEGETITRGRFKLGRSHKLVAFDLDPKRLRRLGRSLLTAGFHFHGLPKSLDGFLFTGTGSSLVCNGDQGGHE